MSTADIRGIIFDLDGVIADTAEFHYQSWQRLADEEGLAFTRQDNDEKLRGTTRVRSLELFTAGLQLDAATKQNWFERKNRYFLEKMVQLQPQDALPGVRSLLDEIEVAALPVAVGSASRNARAVLERLQLSHRFAVIGDGYSVNNSKPAPDIFLWVAGALRLPPRYVLVLEDSQAGIQAARSGGFYTVGIGDIALQGAHAVLPSLKDTSLQKLLSLLPDKNP